MGPWATHIGVFLLGVATWLPFTLWEGQHIKSNRGKPVTEAEAKRSRDHKSFTRKQVVAAMALVVSLLVMGLGLQQRAYQHDKDSHDACVATWARDFTRVLDKRSTANSAQTKAERRRDNAVDNVLLVALGAVQAPSARTDAQNRALFEKRLREFGVKKRRLIEADQHVSKVKSNNAYPKLNCR